MLGMVLLIIAALLWFGIHVGISGTRLRDRLVRRIGERPFRGLFSLLSILASCLLLGAWNVMWTTPLWFAPMWLRWMLVVVMLLAFVLFVASLSQRNPTMIGGEAAGHRRAASIASRVIRCCGRSRCGRRCTSLAAETAARWCSSARSW